MNCRLRPILLITLTAAIARADGADVNRLKLRGYATVYGQTVTLSDVLDLSAADPRLVQQIADEPIGPADEQQTAVTHAQVVRRLDELGVNLGRVLVSGALQCQVTRQASATPATQHADPEGAPLLRTPRTHDSRGKGTLADILRAHVSAGLAELGGQAEVRFERAGQEFLRLTTPPWDFKISSGGREKLGLREFRVVIRRDGQAQRTVHVFAKVKLVREVLVARRPLSLGNSVRRADVGLETRVFEHGADIGLSSIDEVVGQQIKRFVPLGEMVSRDALKSVDLVRRSRPVTIVGAKTGVEVRLTGMAMDSGSYGDTVRVRIGNDRRRRQVLRGVVTGLGTVRLLEGHL